MSDISILYSMLSTSLPGLLNPIIYGLCDSSYRRGYKRVFQLIRSCCHCSDTGRESIPCEFIKLSVLCNFLIREFFLATIPQLNCISNIIIIILNKNKWRTDNRSGFSFLEDEKEEIWLSPITKSPLPLENKKSQVTPQRHNLNFDFRTMNIWTNIFKHLEISHYNNPTLSSVIKIVYGHKMLNFIKHGYVHYNL